MSASNAHRFFLSEQPLYVGAAVDLSPIRHQLFRVLRLRDGERIILLTGDGYEYTAQIEYLDDRSATATVLDRRESVGEPRTHLTLYACALKVAKFEWVLQKGTELGVSRFVPVISERTIVRPASALLRKYDRWRTIIREAAEQSGRGKCPELSQPMMWNEAVSDAAARDSIRVFPWEDAHDERSLVDVVASAVNSETPDMSASLLIGPEGGITMDEAANAMEHSWQIVTLGPRILRAETAALAAITLVLGGLGDLDS